MVEAPERCQKVTEAEPETPTEARNAEQRAKGTACFPVLCLLPCVRLAGPECQAQPTDTNWSDRRAGTAWQGRRHDVLRTHARIRHVVLQRGCQPRTDARNYHAHPGGRLQSQGSCSSRRYVRVCDRAYRSRRRPPAPTATTRVRRTSAGGPEAPSGQSRNRNAHLAVRPATVTACARRSSALGSIALAAMPPTRRRVSTASGACSHQARTSRRVEPSVALAPSCCGARFREVVVGDQSLDCVPAGPLSRTSRKDFRGG